MQKNKAVPQAKRELQQSRGCITPLQPLRPACRQRQFHRVFCDTALKQKGDFLPIGADLHISQVGLLNNGSVQPLKG